MDATHDETEHIERSLVCELPDGVELTEDLWAKIHAHWLSCDRKFLDAAEVLAIASRPDVVAP